MKHYPKTRTALCGLLIPALLPAAGGAPNRQQPNIILIMADDLGFSDIGCYGSEIATSHLDKLAKEGLRFSQFYNASRSCPTRASLLTGLYQHQAGVGDMMNNLGHPSYQGYINTSCVTLAEVLKSAGYSTFMSGKWHVGNRPETLPVRRGFDRYFGNVDGAGSYFERIPYRMNQKAPRMMLDSADYEPPRNNFYFTNAIADYALEFIGGRDADRPFFLYLAFTAPHWPLHALPEDIQKYRGKYRTGWDDIRNQRYKKLSKLGLFPEKYALSARDAQVLDWNTLSESEKDEWDLRMAVYAAMVDRMDQNIGRIMDHLKATGQYDNTVVVFLSDNGASHEATKNRDNYIRTEGATGTRESFDAYERPWANVSNTPFRMYKHWVHEGGISTPFIIRYPGKHWGRSITQEVGHIIDLMPTLVEISGASYPAMHNGHPIVPMEGISLLPALRSGPLTRTTPLFWEHEGNRAVRDGDWKLVSRFDTGRKKQGPWELYNIKQDRTEQQDVSAANPERTQKMIEEYEQWAERVGVVAKERLF